MKRSYVVGLVAGVIALIGIGAVCYYKEFKETNSVLQSNNIVENSKTKVYGVLNTPMENNNMIWCGTFQLAWNELQNNIIKDKIEIVGENKISNELNKQSFIKDYLSDKDYIAMAGYNKDGIVEKINSKLKDKFNEDGKWKVESDLKDPQDILAYSFLKKNLEFENAFGKVKEGINFSGSKVKAFGIYKTNDWEYKEKLLKQVNILYYENDNNFIISLKNKSDKDELILAKIQPKDTLINTLDFAMKKCGSEQEMGSEDILEIPYLNFDINKHFSELEKKSSKNKGFEEYTISSAIQRIEFSLSEKGAVLKSKAEIGMTKGIPGEIKRLVFNSPFLVYMKEKDNNKPYFAMWVENNELMEK